MHFPVAGNVRDPPRPPRPRLEDWDAVQVLPYGDWLAHPSTALVCVQIAVTRRARGWDPPLPSFLSSTDETPPNPPSERSCVGRGAGALALVQLARSLPLLTRPFSRGWSVNDWLTPSLEPPPPFPPPLLSLTHVPNPSSRRRAALDHESGSGAPPSSFLLQFSTTPESEPNTPPEGPGGKGINYTKILAIGCS